MGVQQRQFLEEARGLHLLETGPKNGDPQNFPVAKWSKWLISKYVCANAGIKRSFHPPVIYQSSGALILVQVIFIIPYLHESKYLSIATFSFVVRSYISINGYVHCPAILAQTLWGVRKSIFLFLSFNLFGREFSFLDTITYLYKRSHEWTRFRWQHWF